MAFWNNFDTRDLAQRFCLGILPVCGYFRTNFFVGVLILICLCKFLAYRPQLHLYERLKQVKQENLE